MAIGHADEVVELAPGLGETTRMVLQSQARGYTGVERDAKAAQCRQLPSKLDISVVVGRADQTRLPSRSASVVVGEAMLTMQTAEHN